MSEQRSLIAASEQDEDRWRHVLPGRDPVTKESYLHYQQELDVLAEQNRQRLEAERELP